MALYESMQSLVERNVGGRPTIKTPEIVEKICEAISLGLSNKQASAYAGISLATLDRWREDWEFEDMIETAVVTRMVTRIRLIESGAKSWQSVAWILERQFPLQFARPEVQVLLRAPQQVTNNNLVMTTEQKLQRYLELKAGNGSKDPSASIKVS